MSLTVADAKLRLLPFVLRNVRKELHKFFTNAELINILNKVAEDLNKQASIHIERYYHKTVTDQNYYELDGDVLKMLWFVYPASNYMIQQYSILRVTGTPYKSLIVFKYTPDNDDIQLDITYLRHVNQVTDSDTDEVDIPDRFISEYMDLVKQRILVDYGDQNPLDYDAYLRLKAKEVNKALDPIPMAGKSGVKSYWMGLDNSDDHRFEIKDQRVSESHITANVDGTYTWVD